MKTVITTSIGGPCLRLYCILTAIALGFFALPQRTQAVIPAPDGGYPGQNTAEGQSALLHLGAGTYNTALGWASLGLNLTGNFNTGVGAATLLNNTGDNNTATGAGALLSNTTGYDNTANGAFALFNNTDGRDNAATGAYALDSNTYGSDNTAIGFLALDSNTTGTYNIALGEAAGLSVTTASNVICIGIEGNNVSNSCYIGQIFNAPSSGGTAVFINSNGRLGTATSSQRFKDDIKPMDRASEALFALKPVTFHYKKAFDPKGIPQFGLVAEEVEKVNPDLVVRDKEGKPYSVRYEQVNAMLLNEFLKEHRKVEEQNSKIQQQEATISELKSTVAQQQKGLQAVTARLEQQAAQIQKVSAQLQTNKPAPQMVVNP